MQETHLIGTLLKSVLWLLFIPAHAASATECSPSINVYNRDEWMFKSDKTTNQIGFYTLEKCDSIDIDHVVSLKDAHISGGSSWPAEAKRLFANDSENLVPACTHVNRSKGSATPAEFLRRSGDGKGLDYELVGFCMYLTKYYSIKIKYELSFCNNNRQTFASCGIAID